MLTLIWWLQMNCLHLLTHHDIDHFHHYLGNDQETKKSVWQNETLWLTTCLILLNVDNTISAVTFMNKTTTFQLSTVVGNGLIHGCYIFNDKILLPAWKLCFSLFMAKTFSQFFLLTNLTMVFCVLEVGLPIQWHASISLGSTCTSLFNKTDTWPYYLNYCLVHSQEYGWRLHYCICHTKPNHYDSILVWELWVQLFHILL